MRRQPSEKCDNQKCDGERELRKREPINQPGRDLGDGHNGPYFTDKMELANARRINGVEFVMVGRNELATQSPRQSHAEGIAQRHFVS